MSKIKYTKKLHMKWNAIQKNAKNVLVFHRNHIAA